jgi:hypothetical protein
MSFGCARRSCCACVAGCSSFPPSTPQLRVFNPSGTSCAAPTFSGVISLLNDLRLAAGKSALGFLNPLLYQNPQILTDITAGNNPGCNTDGFEAAPGWVRSRCCKVPTCVYVLVPVHLPAATVRAWVVVKAAEGWGWGVVPLSETPYPSSFQYLRRTGPRDGSGQPGLRQNGGLREDSSVRAAHWLRLQPSFGLRPAHPFCAFVGSACRRACVVLGG